MAWPETVLPETVQEAQNSKLTIVGKRTLCVNEAYFFGLIEKPNLVRHNSMRRLGSYEYGSDTMSISEVLLPDKELLDYVMYHEMLHKKHKFNSKNGRNYHHTQLFRKNEKEFENSERIERELSKVLKTSQRKRLFGKLFGF